MTIHDHTWRPARYDADGHRRDAARFLHGGVRRDDLLLSETAVITRSGVGVEAFVRAMAQEPERWEPPVAEFGRGPMMVEARFDWGLAAFVALCLGLVALWLGICVYGLIRGLQELERAL